MKWQIKWIVLAAIFLNMQLHAAWSSPSAISLSGASAVSNPQLAADSFGNVVSVWFQDGNIFGSLLSQNNAFWSQPIQISADIEQAYNPQVAICDQGFAMAIWKSSNSPTQSIFTSTFDIASNTWTTPYQLSDPSLYVDEPQITINSSGLVYATWISSPDLSLWSVQVASFSNNVWSAPSTISSLSVSASVPQIVVDSNGNATAIWLSVDVTSTEKFTVLASTYSSGTWSQPEALSDAIYNAQSPSLSIDSLGNIFAVWFWYDGVSFIIQTSRKPVGADWSAVTNLSVSGADSFDPQIAVDPSGNAVCIWVNSDGTNYRVQEASFSISTLQWSEAFSLSLTQYDARDMQIALTSNGLAVAVWQQETETSPVIQTAQFFLGNQLLLSPIISSQNDTSSSPQIVWSPAGYFVSIWENDTLLAIESALFNPAILTNQVVPNVGSTQGNNQVSITGSNFTLASKVYFGQKSALNFSVVSDTQILATVPPGSGTVPVTVYTPQLLLRQFRLKDSPIMYIYQDMHRSRKFYGKLKRKRNLHHHKNFQLKAYWKAPKQMSASSYNIYQDRRVKYSLNGSTIKFKKHVRSSQHLQHRYAITAVNAAGVESTQRKLKICKR